MHPVVVVMLIVSLFAAGVYVGVSGIATQYGIGTSDSGATEGVACAPVAPTIVIGQAAMFSVAGIPDTTVRYWSSAKGRSELADDGTFRVTFTEPGAKEVSVFWMDGGRWQRARCGVVVR